MVCLSSAHLCAHCPDSLFEFLGSNDVWPAQRHEGAVKITFFKRTLEALESLKSSRLASVISSFSTNPSISSPRRSFQDLQYFTTNVQEYSSTSKGLSSPQNKYAPSTMAKAFLRQLPKIPIYALPGDARCPICVQPYENQTTDSGSFEKAVRLPCNDNHIFGSECLSEWLSHGKTCPFCRHEMVFLHEDDKATPHDNTNRFFWIFSIERSQGWDEFWYVTFWILQLQGDEAVERKWQQWQQDWIAAAEQWDAGSKAQARAALSISKLTPRNSLEDKREVRMAAAGIQTLRFREYRLYLLFQPESAERPKLKAPPGFQLTPAQEGVLFRELERREGFNIKTRYTAISRRGLWSKLRDVGFVWDPDCEGIGRSRRGGWSRYAY